MKTPRTSLKLLLLFLSAICPLPGLLGQEAGAEPETSGIVEGRVFDVTSANYLGRALVTVEGTNLQTFTNDAGEFRLQNVPSGEVRVRALYTGLQPSVQSFSVMPGKTVQRNFRLYPYGIEASDEQVFELTEFVVEGNKTYDAASIAINQQRFAANITNVVTSEEYGDISEGNFGNFLQYVPGMAINYSGVEAESVTVRGVPPEQTPVTIDGNPSTNAGASSRAFPINQLSMNDIARVEVTKSVTPDQTANAIGGTVNIVRKSAFDYRAPSFSYRVYATVNSLYKDWGDTAGPNDDMSGWRIRPNFDFSYANPVSEKWGFTLNGFYTSRYIGVQYLIPQWAPHNLPIASGTPEEPVLLRMRYPTNPAMQERWSTSASVDWKPNQRNLFKFALTHSNSSVYNAQIDQRWNVGNVPADYGPTFTEGKPGGGNVQYITTGGYGTSPRYDASLNWTHYGEDWKIDSAVFYSFNDFKRRDLGKGLWSATTTIPKLTVRFDDIQKNEGPGQIVAESTTNPGLDVYDSRNAYLGRGTSSEYDSPSTLYGARLDLSRDLHTAIPLSVSFGGQINIDDRERPFNRIYADFVGPDGRKNTEDDLVGNYDIVAEEFSRQGMPWGRPDVVWYENEGFVNLFRQHPEWFNVLDAPNVRDSNLNSFKVKETVTAGYVRFDAFLMDNRLGIVAGARYEHTEDDGYGPRTDIEATYQRDSNGEIIYDQSGKPSIIDATPEELAALQYQKYGSHLVSSYDDIYPSINMNYKIREDLVLRFAYARTLGRPNYNEIIPRMSVDPETSLDPTIKISNIGLKPWTANNYDLSLEFYPKKGGVISVAVFQKDISDFFEDIRFPATSEYLESIGLDDSYLDYEVVTRTNGADAKIQGLEYNFRFLLDDLQPWITGLGVFLNGTELDISGTQTADFTGFAPRIVNWGLFYRAKRFTVNINWNYSGKQQMQLISGGPRPDDNFRYRESWTQVGASLQVKVTKSIDLFASVRNLLNEHRIEGIYAPVTPDYARVEREINLGAFWNVGIKGKF